MMKTLWSQQKKKMYSHIWEWTKSILVHAVIPKPPDLSCVTHTLFYVNVVNEWVFECLIACCLSMLLRWKCTRTPLSTLISLTTKIARTTFFLNNHRHTHFQSLLDSLVACTGTFCLTEKNQWRRQETMWTSFYFLSSISIVKRNVSKGNTSLQFWSQPSVKSDKTAGRVRNLTDFLAVLESFLKVKCITPSHISIMWTPYISKL